MKNEFPASRVRVAGTSSASRAVVILIATIVLTACAARVEPTTTPSQPVSPVEQAAAAPAAGGNIGNGQRVYEVNCVFCHGPDGSGGPGGGAPLVKVTDPEHVVRTVNDGRGYTMPSFYGLLSEAEIRDVGLYVTQRLAN